MKTGLTMFPTDRSVRPDELAVEAERRGYESLYFPEHTHIPLDGSHDRLGRPLAEMYKRGLDPFLALTAAAMATTTLRLGTGVSLVAQRDPITTAKVVATLDHLSGGRFVFGFGYGWNAKEMADHGITMGQRRAIVRERMLVMRALWADEVASYEGEFARLSQSWAWPKPVQRPHPPLLLGGEPGPKLFAHIAEYCDGWMPYGGSGLSEALPKLRAAFEEAGRDPDALRIVVFGAVPTPGKLDYFRELGVDEVVFTVPSAGWEELNPALDDLQPYVDA